jgi:hypothetical protein
MRSKNGSAKPGPSKAYIRVLQGKMSSKQYAKTIVRGARIKSA